MNLHSSNGILITCDAVMKQYILKLQEDANAAASSTDSKAAKINPAKKRAIVKLEADAAAAAALVAEADGAGSGVDLIDTSFLRSVTFIDLDDTHLFATGAPSDIQERLQKQVDILHEQHTCTCRFVRLHVRLIELHHFNEISFLFLVLLLLFC